MRGTKLAITAAGAGIGILCAEAAWVVLRRDLPSLDGLDASGAIGPAGEDDHPLRLVALGDSTLTGPGLDRAEHVWIRRALDATGSARPIELRSLAVGGSRVADVRRLVPDALALAPDAVVVAVGSNDAIHATPPRRFEIDLDAMLDELLAEVGVVGVCNVGDLGNVARVPRPLADLLRARSRLVRRQIERTVAKHPGAVLLDVTPSDGAMRDRSMYAADRFHPNAEGHARWGDAAVPGLTEVLRRAGALAPCTAG